MRGLKWPQPNLKRNVMNEILYATWQAYTVDKEIVITNESEIYKIVERKIVFKDSVMPIEEPDALEYLENAVGAILFHGLPNDFMEVFLGDVK